MPSASLVLENLAAARRLLEAALHASDRSVERIGAAVGLRDAAVKASALVGLSPEQTEIFRTELEAFDRLVGHRVGGSGRALAP